MAKGKANNITLSDEQFNEIKDAILDNVLKVLPNIINEIFPVIMDKVSDIIKTNINDYVPTSDSNNSHGNDAKEIKDFIKSNNAAWVNFVKKRKDQFYKYTRCDQLINLYNDCLAEEPMYIPRKFRQDSMYTMNDHEKKIYEKLNLEKLKTEMEILTTRREHFRLQLDSTDSEFKAWLDSKELVERLENNISLEWQKDVENANSRIEEVWENNIEGKKNAFMKDKKDLQKKLNSTSSRTQHARPQNQNQNGEHTNDSRQDHDETSRYNNSQSKNSRRYHHQPYKRRYYHPRSSTYHHTRYQHRNNRY